MEGSLNVRNPRRMYIEELDQKLGESMCEDQRGFDGPVFYRVREIRIQAN